ncbi:hypothetical protein [Haloferula sargassicola]|uniref:Uncharacterized protein n=1 Tax=Haloferula sargassicola TaxID=490096 RepID=A0ABP9UPX4_9BACT
MRDELSGLWNVYGEVFCQHSHQLLAWAYQDVRHRFVPGLDEPDMTGLLAEAMENRLNDPSTPDAYLHYTIGDQMPRSPAGQLGNKRLRLDITVIRSGIRPRLSFIFEAKRLRTNSLPIGKYVGSGGMGDFISGRYAGEAPEAAMIGLIENQTLQYWQSELQRAFVEDSKSPSPCLSVISELAEVSIIQAIAGELESTHQRGSGLPLRLFHIFLEC